MGRSVFIFAALLMTSFGANAFEIKGYSAGMDVGTLDLKQCEKVANADSGIPGFRCSTTLGGDQAELRLAVFEEKLVAAIFRVSNGRMSPTLEALSEKYGRPSKSNRYIEDYDWREGRTTLAIKEDRVRGGYRLLLIDFSLFDKAKAVQKENVKKDL